MKKLLSIFMLFIMLGCCPCFSTVLKTNTIVLTETNTIVLNDEVNQLSIGKLLHEAAQLDQIGLSSDPIYLILDTPGGSIVSGLTAIEFLQNLRRPVHTITIFAASMGFHMAQSLGTRYTITHGTFMSHKASGGFFGEFGDGMSQLDSRYGLWLRKIQKMDEIVVERTKGKQTMESYRAAIQNELWLNGWEAVVQGYADKVEKISCNATLLKNTTIHKVSFMGFIINLEFSQCPLNTYPISVTVEIPTNKGLMDLDAFLASGGVFGGNVAPLYSLDPTLTIERVRLIAEQAVAKYSNKNYRAANGR